jgi:hypothetical protein
MVDRESGLPNVISKSQKESDFRIAMVHT